MNETLTRLLIFSAGCLTGATITFSALKNRFDERLHQELEAEKIRHNDELKKLAEETRRNDIRLAEDTESELQKAANEVAKSLEDLATVFSPTEDEPTIYPITADEFGANGYDEQQLYFYAADETLADENDNIVEADETTVGNDGIDIFIYTTAENCYIRNSETKTDYEILKVDGSFASYESEGPYD